MRHTNQAKNILVVDDDVSICSIIKDILETEKYSVQTVTGGYECLEVLQNGHPDMIILDVMMPGINGIQVCQQLKNDPTTMNIPVIFVTGLYDYDSRINGKKAGGDEFLYKPIDATELLVRTKNLLKLKEYHDLLKKDRDVLEQKVQERTGELRQAHEETLIRLSIAAEFKDHDTGEHLIRMSCYAECIARSLGADEKHVSLIRQASICHDIGKIGVPEYILLKPGSLNASEWDVMRDHTRIGASILGNSKSEVMRLAETIALYHHENWDGSGYPYGLSGDDIPWEARIVRLADVFDALTSKRIYKEAFSVEHSLRIIREESGRQFDPSVVRGFESVLDDILNLHNNKENNQAWYTPKETNNGLQLRSFID